MPRNFFFTRLRSSNSTVCADISEYKEHSAHLAFLSRLSRLLSHNEAASAASEGAIVEVVSDNAALVKRLIFC